MDLFSGIVGYMIGSSSSDSETQKSSSQGGNGIDLLSIIFILLTFGIFFLFGDYVYDLFNMDLLLPAVNSYSEIEMFNQNIWRDYIKYFLPAIPISLIVGLLVFMYRLYIRLSHER